MTEAAGMTDARRMTAIVILFAIGFALVGLASAVSSTWPLFVTPLPYALIAWLVVRGSEGDAEAHNGERASPERDPLSSRGQDLNL